MGSGRDVGELVAGYRPRQMPPEAGGFARSLVAAAAPPSATRAKALLWAAARLAAFGLSVGLEVDAAVLLHPAVVERFVLVGCTDVSPAARRTLRANVRWLAKTADRHGPAPVALAREHAKTPYSEREMAAWLALADTQGSEARRMRAQGLICLGAGAGLTGSDLAGVAGGGQPLAGMAPSFNVGPDEIPPRGAPGDPDDEVGRGLPEVIIAQLLAPANLELLGPMWQRLVRLAIDTGRRPDELCRLRFHCLDEDLAVDGDGNQQRHPVLVHDQPKTRRRGVRLPIAESTARVIKDQQDAVVAEYPDTPTDRLALFPCRQWNVNGERGTSPSSLAPVIIEWRRRLQLYDAVFRDGHLEPLLGAGGEPIPFPSEAIFAYAFRHTYAQRHIDANVGLEMLASLMGHTNLNTTGAYYRIRTQQKREALAKVTQYQLNVRAGVTSAPGTASHAMRLELGSISTPMGTCVEPSNVKALGRACPFRHRCFGCAHFRTDISHLPELRAYLHQLLLAREELVDTNPDLAEWARVDAMPSDEEIDTVRRLIDGCEGLLDQLPVDERQELMRHTETLREGRQHLADTVPVALTAKVIQPTPTVFPALHLVKDRG